MHDARASSLKPRGRVLPILFAALAWPDKCEDDFEAAYPEGEEYGGLEFHRLSRGVYLVEVVCDGGGIQPAAVFVLGRA